LNVHENLKVNPVAVARLGRRHVEHPKQVPYTSGKRLPSLEFEDFTVAIGLPGSASFNCLGPGGARDGHRDFEPRLLAKQLTLVVGGGGQVYEYTIGDGLGASVGVNGSAPEVVVLAWHRCRINSHGLLPSHGGGGGFDLEPMNNRQPASFEVHPVEVESWAVLEL
jgi:hypothetical protein